MVSLNFYLTSFFLFQCMIILILTYRIDSDYPEETKLRNEVRDLTARYEEVSTLFSHFE